MKKNNRIKLHIIFLAVTLMFSANFSFVYAKDVDVYSEVNALKLTSALGITSSDFVPNSSKKVTRAQFAMYAARMMLSADFKLNSDTVLPFSDVAINDEEYPYIAFLYGQKIVSGDGSGFFRPDDNITADEMSKILLGVTGYLPVAQSSAGAYSAFAARQNLFGNIEFSDGINENQLVEILYNTLLSNAYSGDEYSNDGTYKLKSDKTVIEEYFGVAQHSGVYDANDKTSLVGNGTGKNGFITVDGTKYKTEIDIPEDLFGKTVVYYARENANSPDEIICIYEESGNNEIVLADDEIESVADYKIEYSSDGGKTRKVTVDAGADLIYNNISYKKWKMSDVLISNGTVTLIDNNNDNKIDVIKVMSYEDYVALSYSDAGKSIALRFNDGNINIDDKDCEYSLYLNGGKAEWDVISDWDVLSVAKSHIIDGMYYCRIDITRGAVNGKIDEVSDDGIVINGIEYKTVNAPRSRLDTKIGESGSFYKNILGKIVASDNNERLKYAYVRDAYCADDDGKKVYLHLMYDSYSDQKLLCSKKVNIDTKQKKDSDVTGAVGIGTLIRFKTNSDGEITDIDTANGENTSSLNSLSDGGTFLDVQYKSGANVFLNAVIIDNETKVFVVPFDDVDIFYRTADINYFRGDVKYDITAYDLSETKVAKAVVVNEKQNNRAVNDSNSISVVTGIKRKINDNGDECISLSLIRDGLEIDSLWIDTDDWEKYSDLKKGDVITYEESSADNCRIVLVRTLFSPEKRSLYYHKNISNAGTKLIVTYGRVKAYGEESLLINVDSNDESVVEPYYIKPKMNFYIYDSKSKEVKTGTFADVNVGDEVFLRESYYAVQEGFIVR